MSTTTAGAVFVASLLIALVLLYRPFGDHMYRTVTATRHSRFERLVYQAVGVNPDGAQAWGVYARSVLAFSAVSILFLYVFQRVQQHLWLSLGFDPVEPDQAWNTAVSFVTNTNWQSYSGESTMGHLVQMAGLAVQNFTSAAVGVAVAVALVRGFARSRTSELAHHPAALAGGIRRIGRFPDQLVAPQRDPAGAVGPHPRLVIDGRQQQPPQQSSEDRQMLRVAGHTAAGQGELVLIDSGGQSGDSNRPCDTTPATRHAVTMRSTNRPATARAAASTAATASANTVAAASGITGSAATATSSPVNHTRTCSAFPANRRNQPRTVSNGRSSTTATGRAPSPDAFAARARPITATVSARRRSTPTGSSTCVAEHPAQRTRRGRSSHRAPASPRSTRGRAHPHPVNRPAHAPQRNPPTTS